MLGADKEVVVQVSFKEVVKSFAVPFGGYWVRTQNSASPVFVLRRPGGESGRMLQPSQAAQLGVYPPAKM